MKRIFRSIIDIRKDGEPTISQVDLVKNYRSFLASDIKPDEASFVKIYNWIEAHFRSFEEIPAIELLYEKANNEAEEAILATLREVIEQQPYIGSNYKAILSEKFDEQNKEDFQKILTSAWEVVNSGKILGKGRNKKEIKGIGDALEYFNTETRRFRMSTFGFRTEGEIRTKEDRDEIIEAYEEVKRDPFSKVGLYTNLRQIDDSCRGVKIKELMLIAAFVGQGKTTISSNFAYNGIMQGLNGMYVAMEMSFSEMRDMFAILHTCRPEWLQYPKFKKMVGNMSFNKLMDGEFNDLEEEFFKVSLDDFTTNPDYGSMFIYEPTEPLTPSRLELKMYDYQATLKEKGKTLDFVLVDYVGLMVPNPDEKYSDTGTNLNTILKKLKAMAMTFDGGRGVRMISPFQTSREGWKEAEKNDGNYKLTALSYANEAERSSDIVISLYMSKEMQSHGIMKIGCLKNRRRGHFSPFQSRVNFESKQVSNIIQTNKTDMDSHLQELPVETASS